VSTSSDSEKLRQQSLPRLGQHLRLPGDQVLRLGVDQDRLDAVGRAVLGAIHRRRSPGVTTRFTSRCRRSTSLCSSYQTIRSYGRVRL
jgi:hypothetical protein